MKNLQKDSVFKDINYPPEKKDYETFESNNTSTKLMIFEITDDLYELKIHHNETKNNDRTITISFNININKACWSSFF